jgi:hypothetical protein
MSRFARLTLLLCLVLTTSAVSHPVFAGTTEEQIAARLNALEKENAALRARVNRLEAPKTVRIQSRANVEPTSALASIPALKADPLAADPDRVFVARNVNAPRFEVSGSLLFLQPGAGNLEYATLVNPLPPVSPHWNNQALAPNFAPSFAIGGRYWINESNDIALNWTHLNSTATDSVVATPLQMIGPPYLIGPESGLYKIAHGEVRSQYDSVKLDGGHTFCVECAFQLRAFGGVEFARIGQDLTGTFQSRDGSASTSNAGHSTFTGAGPRVGVKGQYALGNFDLISEVAGAALMGVSQSRLDFVTVNPSLADPTVQYLASPNATRIVPSIDARLATAYTFPATNYGLFKVEVGYQGAVYFDAVNAYAVTQVPTSLVLPPRGIYLATAQHLQSNFTTHGPYVTAKWLFQ